jgi:hypothetical protein
MSFPTPGQSAGGREYATPGYRMEPLLGKDKCVLWQIARARSRSPGRCNGRARSKEIVAQDGASIVAWSGHRGHAPMAVERTWVRTYQSPLSIEVFYSRVLFPEVPSS